MVRIDFSDMTDRDLIDALTFWATRSIVDLYMDKGPKCEECDEPMGKPFQTLHTDDWEYDFYDCPNCGHENVVF